MSEWNPNQQISLLPEEISSRFIEIAESLLADLQTNRLKTALKESDPNKPVSKTRRYVVSENAETYKILYWQYYRNFRRERAERALTRIVEGKDHRYRRRVYKYDFIYREFIFRMLTEGFILDGDRNSRLPDNSVREFFGLSRIEELEHRSLADELESMMFSPPKSLDSRMHIDSYFPYSY